MFNLKSTVIFLAGIASGAAVAYSLTKKKYEDILKEEIQSVKDTYKNRKETVVKENVEEDKEVDVEESQYEPNENDINKYNNILKTNGYVNYGAYMNNDGGQVENNNESTRDPYNVPYIIDPEEFGSGIQDTVQLTYYADKVLVDDVDEVIEGEEIEYTVGVENLKIFEEYGAQTIMVRNEILNIDYEITKDDWNYSDFTDIPLSSGKERKPHDIG